VTIITHTDQQMHKIYIKSRIIHIYKLSYTFQPWETLKQKNIKLIQPIYIHKVKNIY